ncbi:MAG: acetoacetate decarboxylase family protein [Erysipelotrichaceae bacterium]|nr:acetoacetate decarboxylase family protein [Erysipelotrichaceae bacterium]
MKNGAMNNQYGIQFFAIADPEAAAKALPPHLELIDPNAPLLYGYIVNIREPTFAPWYMEGGIGLMARYGQTEGLYFLGLQLSGPGALMGAFSGREGSGLPKKLCECIVVEREGDWGHCLIKRKGVTLVDVKLHMGNYNDTSLSLAQEGCTRENPIVTEGGCLLYKCQMESVGFSNMRLMQYDSPTRFYSWEPATAEITLSSSKDDPWGEIPIVKVLGAGWMVSDNYVNGLYPLLQLTDEETQQTMQYLFSGRFDQCTLTQDHQHYE